MKNTILRWYNLVFINAYSYGLSFMWNAIHQILLPLLILQVVPDIHKNAGLGLLTSVGLIMALIVQPISGAMSDSTQHRWGRRRPWLLAGTLGDILFLLILALSKSYGILALGYIGLQITSNLAHGANQGLIPDLVPEHRRGEAAGIKSALEMVALVIAAAAIGGINQGDRVKPAGSFLLIAAVLGLSLFITWIGIQKMPTRGYESKSSQKTTLRKSLRIDLKSNRDYALLIAVRFLLLFGIYTVQSFALYYCQDVLHLPNPARLVSRIIGITGVGVLAVAYPAGLMLEKLGRKRISLISSSSCAVGITLLLLARSQTGVYLAGSFLGVGLGIFYTVNWAWATSLVPAAEAGKYLGLANLATAGSGAIARALGPLVDLGNRSAPNAGYFGLYMAALLAVLGSLLLTRQISERPPVPADPFPVKNVFIAQ